MHGDSRLRLVTTGPNEHRVELARGWISAHVTAPPRLFVVDTPVATAVDLGCAYELRVAADTHAAHLVVRKGAVSLEGARGFVYVPATFEVDIAPDHHIGLPVHTTASDPVRLAVRGFAQGVPESIDALVAAADIWDRVTLWNAINVTTRDRNKLVAALERLAPLPDPALHAKVLVADPDAMDIWLDVFVERGALAHDKRK
jgi:hypothetical protein